MTLVKKRERDDGSRSLELQGLIHTFTAMDAMSTYTPVLLRITRVNEVLCALLDQEDVDELHEFLSHYITKE